MKRWIFCFSLLFLVNTSVFAAIFNNHSISPIVAWQGQDIQDGWYIKAGGGASFPKATKTNYIFTQWSNDRFTLNHIDSSALVSAEIGYRWYNARDWFPFFNLGAAYTYIFKTDAHGTVYQNILPEVQAYSYRQQIKRQTVMAILKGDIYQFGNLMPYLAFGLGVAINRVEGFRDYPNPNVMPHVTGFANNTTSYFSYMGAFGLDFILHKNVTASVEYNWGYYGHIRTGYAQTPTSTGYDFVWAHLNNRITASAVLATVSYSLNIC